MLAINEALKARKRAKNIQKQLKRDQIHFKVAKKKVDDVCEKVSEDDRKWKAYNDKLNAGGFK